MICAVVLAAGLSRRMGRFKLLLPWGATTVLGRVVETLERAGVPQIVVVTGHRAGEIEEALAGTTARTAFNPEYAAGEMLSSIQAGLRALGPDVEAALLCLGDQPQIQVATVRAVLAAGAALAEPPAPAEVPAADRADARRRVVIPSYQMHAGHPILLARDLWEAVLQSEKPLRAVLNAHRAQIHYLPVDTPTILADLDTPDDYRARPEAHP